jgi:hypothetical protein
VYCKADPVVLCYSIQLVNKIHELLNFLIDFFNDAFIVIYADDIAIICKNLEKLQMLINKLSEWATLNGLKLNAGKTKVLKFRRGGALLNTDVLTCNGEHLEFVKSFKYLGVTFQQTGKAFALHIKDKCKCALTATYSISNLHLLSIYTAVELFHIKVSPVASYGIERIWPFLSYRDLNNMEAVKSIYLKRLLCVSKYFKSRQV